MYQLAVLQYVLTVWCLNCSVKVWNLLVAVYALLQAQAINAAISRENVIIATSTASGKSVCYNTPVLEDIVADNESCALYLFPTKASIPSANSSIDVACVSFRSNT